MDSSRDQDSIGVIVAICDKTYLWVVSNNPHIDVYQPTHLPIPKGAMLVFKGSTVHAGDAYDQQHFRLHFYASQKITEEEYTYFPNSLLTRHLKALDDKVKQNQQCATSLRKKRKAQTLQS